VEGWWKVGGGLNPLLSRAAEGVEGLSAPLPTHIGIALFFSVILYYDLSLRITLHTFHNIGITAFNPPQNPPHTLNTPSTQKSLTLLQVKPLV